MSLVERVSPITRTWSKHALQRTRRFYVRFFSRDNDREFVERNEVRSAYNETRVDPPPLPVSPSRGVSVLIVDRRLKFRQGRTMSVSVKRSRSRLILKLDASSSVFSRGLQLTSRNNDSFNPVQQRERERKRERERERKRGRECVKGRSSAGRPHADRKTKRIYGNCKVPRLRQSPSNRVCANYAFYWTENRD